MNTIGTRIAHYRKLRGLSQSDLAKACGWSSQSRVGNYERDVRKPSFDDVRSIAKVLMVSPAALMNWETSSQDGEDGKSSAAEIMRAMLEKHATRLSPEAQQQLLDAIESSPAPDVVPENNVVRGKFARPSLKDDEIRIARYDVQGSMGGGKLVHDYPEMFRDVVVSQAHLRELGITYKDPSHLKMISGSGMSMAPIIQHMDPMIIDISIREFNGDGIYAFAWQGHFYIKSLQIADEDHFWMISGDSSLYPPRKIRVDDTYIQARVLLVWTGKRV